MKKVASKTRKVNRNKVCEYVTKSHFDFKMGSVEKDISGLKTDVSGLKTGVEGLKKDVAVLKTDVAELKVDVANIKYDINEMKGDISEIKEGQKEMMSLLDGYVKSNEDMKQDFYIMRAEMKEVKKVIKEKLGVEISVI